MKTLVWTKAKARALVLASFALPASALFVGELAAQPPTHDEDWPCIQRKVPEMKPAQVWAGPPLDEALRSWRSDSEIAALVSHLAARRLPTEEAQAEIAEFAEAAGAEKNEKLTLLFAGLFQRLNNERGRVVAGIERYAQNQHSLAESIKDTRQQLAAQQGEGPRRDGSVTTPRRDGVDATPSDLDDNLRFASELDEKLYWDTRIYDERHRALTYVCDSPVMIEQRIFALGRAIQQHLD